MYLKGLVFKPGLFIQGVCIVYVQYKMSRVVRKLAFCICENKDADQLRRNREADQRLCFRYMDSTIPLLSESEITSLCASSVAVQPGLCQTWSETPKTGFLRTRLKYSQLKRLWYLSEGSGKTTYWHHCICCSHSIYVVWKENRLVVESVFSLTKFVKRSAH